MDHKKMMLLRNSSLRKIIEEIENLKVKILKVEDSENKLELEKELQYLQFLVKKNFGPKKNNLAISWADNYQEGKGKKK